MATASGNIGINFIMWWIGIWCMDFLSSWLFEVLALFTMWHIDLQILFQIMEIFKPVGMEKWMDYQKNNMAGVNVK